MSRGIELEGGWTAVARQADEDAARNPGLSTDLRIVSAARWRMDGQGHSHFPKTGADSLPQVLARVNRATGELTPMTDRGVRKALAALVAAGLLSSRNRSSLLCLRLPRAANDAGGGTRSRKRCPNE